MQVKCADVGRTRQPFAGEPAVLRPRAGRRIQWQVGLGEADRLGVGGDRFAAFEMAEGDVIGAARCQSAGQAGWVEIVQKLSGPAQAIRPSWPPQTVE